MVRAVLLASAFVGLASALGSTDTITWGGDNSRAGYQTNHNMDPAVVGTSQFDQIFRTALPGVYVGSKEQIFSQPLVYTPSTGDKQYVYFATTQNNLYKLDAKTGEILLSRSLHIPFLAADLDGCVDINPTIGVTATGVIDPDTDTLYLTSKTYVDQDAGETAQGRPAGRYYVHAIDTNDLSERPNFPVDLEGLIATNNPERMFTAGIHHQRPGLLHTGQYIYAGFASHCVQYNFTGWIIGWDKTTGNIVEQFTTEGAGVENDIKGGGIWMSGGGLASDDAGSLFFGSGNGYASQLSNVPVNGFNPPTSLEEAAVHMAINDDGSLGLADFFMPWEKQALDGADKDLGTSPLELLPSEFSCGDIKRIGVITGKSGKTYWLNLDNLGGYRNGADGLDNVIQVYQNENSVYAGAGVYPLEGGYVYINVIRYPSHVFKFACDNGVPSFTKVADTPTDNAYILGVSHGTVTSLNGQTGTGLLWITDVQGLNLRIYDAVPQDGTLNLINSFSIPGVTKFTRAVFGDGIVYIGTTQGYVYGYGSPVNVPLNCTSPVDFGTVDIKDVSEQKTVTCKALTDITIKGAALASGKDFTLSDEPAFPLDLAEGDSFTVSALFKPTSVGILSDNVLVDTSIVEGYSISTNARLSGVGQSAAPLLSISPDTTTFQGVITGADPSGSTSESVIMSNNGNSELTIQSVSYSTDSLGESFTTWDRTSDLVVGKFTVLNIPTTIPANGANTLSIRFNSSESGTFSGTIKVVSDGGNDTFYVAGSSGPAPVALLEFQTPDAQDWVTYKPGEPFTFGNVTENTSRSLRFRVTNNAPTGGVRLSLTVSKPPFGVDSIIRAANQVDLAEGTSLAPGDNASAVLTCNVPKSQWDVDSYNGTANWTMNTNDENFDKQFIEFFCEGVAEQAPPLLPDGQAQYRYLGCYKENNPGRQLSSQLFGDDDLTTAECIAACAEKDFIYCGTQYHRECWAGNTIPVEQVDDTNCNFYCSGAINQICGGDGEGDGAGGSYISLFGDSIQCDGNFTDCGGDNGGGDDGGNGGGGGNPSDPVVNPGVDGYVSIGCYTEATQGRALPNGETPEVKTVANCVAACSADGYIYAGLEYAGECWCGNVFGAGAVAAPSDECNLACNGNATEYCGGNSRLNVYQLGSIPKPTTSTSLPSNTTATVSSLSSTTTTTSLTAPTGPAIKETIGGWKFQGCWTETDDGRALSDSTYASDDMTLESCGAFCSGHTYFGVEYGRECYCGDTLKSASVKADDQEDCSFPCAGDKSEYCGAGMRLELYRYGSATTPSSSASATASSSSKAKTTTAASATSLNHTMTASSTASPTPTGPIVYKGNSNFTYYSCVSEPSAGRLMDNQIFNDGDKMTIEACLERCYMYDYAGVEYGRECWCGDTLDLKGYTDATPGKNVTDSECNFLCPGDDKVYCGAGSRLSLYIHKDEK